MKPFLVLLVAMSAAPNLSTAGEAETGKKPGDPGESKYSILYTGRLFGYFRYPNIQRIDDTGCPQGAALSRAGAEFINQAHPKQSNELRVAMGDNFSPELLSVTMRDKNQFHSRDIFVPYREKQKDGSELPKWLSMQDGMKHDSNNDGGEQKDGIDEGLYPWLHGTVPSDNVACFLQDAQFQAIVPGADDFYLGPEHVSDLARFLTQSHGEKLKPVQMLAANLIVSTLKHKAAKPLPSDELPKGVKEALSPKYKDIGIKLPLDVLPWLYGVTVTGTDSMSEKEKPSEARLCKALPEDPTNFVKACKDSKRYITLTEKPDCKGYFLTNPEQIHQPEFILQPDNNYAFCLVWKNEKENDKKKEDLYCKTFTVRQPLLQVSKDAAAPDNDKPQPPVDLDEASPKPYFVSKDNPEVVVFGVVDPTLMQQVGLLNYSWRNKNGDYDTTVKVTDPADALQQVMALCDKDTSCKNIRHRVLLAQMPIVKARHVVEQIEKIREESGLFDAVLTQVDSRDYTGSVVMTAARHSKIPGQSKAGQSNNVAATGTFFVIPDTHYDLPPSDKLLQPDYKLTIRIQKAVLTMNNEICCNTNSLNNSVSEFDLSNVLPEQAQNKVKDFRDEVERQFDRSVVTSDSRAAYEYLALKGMLKFCHADLAIIQPRDIYPYFGTSAALWMTKNEPGMNDQNLPDALFSKADLLQEVLWKGDLVVCRTLTGADLKNALKQSDSILAQSNAGLANKDLSLVVLGANADTLHGTYIIDGEPLNEKRLYSVALTDFLAYGDTGYSDLSAADLPPADSMRTSQGSKLIAEVAWHAIDKKEHFDSLTAKQYHDVESKETPPDLRRGFNELEQLKDWFEHWMQAYPFAPVLFQKSPKDKNPGVDAMRAAAQNRSYSYFNLEKMNIAYNLTTIQGAQQLVPAKFGGISNVPQLQALESQTVSAWERIHFGHVFSHYVEFFGTAETRYGFSRGRARPKGNYDPYQVSITENAVQLETGLLTKRLTDKLPFRFLLSDRLATQFRAPLLSFSAPALGAPPLKAPANCSVTSIDVAPPVNAASQASVLCAVPRSLLQQTKIGTRVENQESWLEVGWETGHNFNSPLGYVLNKGTASEVDCSASTNESITSCITLATSKPVTALSPLYVTHQTLPVSGWFLNFKLIVPVYAKTVQFGIENYSEIFSKHIQDTSADTRFYQDTVLSLPVKIFQNLSISPQVEAFNYQNKLFPQHFLSFTSKIVLDYNFDWHTGVTRSKAIAFPDPNTVTKTSALPAP